MFFSAYLLSDLVFWRVLPRLLTNAGVVGENEVDGGRFDRGYLVWLVKTTSTSETRNQA
jgi:hypothetical protein